MGRASCVVRRASCVVRRASCVVRRAACKGRSTSGHSELSNGRGLRWVKPSSLCRLADSGKRLSAAWKRGGALSSASASKGPSSPSSDGAAESCRALTRVKMCDGMCSARGASGARRAATGAHVQGDWRSRCSTQPRRRCDRVRAASWGATLRPCSNTDSAASAASGKAGTAQAMEAAAADADEVRRMTFSPSIFERCARAHARPLGGMLLRVAKALRNARSSADLAALAAPRRRLSTPRRFVSAEGAARRSPFVPGVRTPGAVRS